MTVAILKGGASGCWNLSVFYFLIDVDINSNACYEQGGDCSVTAMLAGPSGILLYISHSRVRNRTSHCHNYLGTQLFLLRVFLFLSRIHCKVQGLMPGAR